MESRYGAYIIRPMVRTIAIAILIGVVIVIVIVTCTPMNGAQFAPI